MAIVDCDGGYMTSVSVFLSSMVWFYHSILSFILFLSPCPSSFPRAINENALTFYLRFCLMHTDNRSSSPRPHFDLVHERFLRQSRRPPTYLRYSLGETYRERRAVPWTVVLGIRSPWAVRNSRKLVAYFPVVCWCSCAKDRRHLVRAYRVIQMVYDVEGRVRDGIGRRVRAPG